MSAYIRQVFVTFLISCGIAAAQSTLNFKTRHIDTSSAQPVTELRSRPTGSQHLLIQFDHPPLPAEIAELTGRGVKVLSDVPDNGLVVMVAAARIPVEDLGIRFAEPIDPADKISPVVSTTGFVLVEFHPDVDINLARALILYAGSELRENPDLGPHHLMIPNDPAVVAALTKFDEVAYVFPASRGLVRGSPTLACVGALTTNGATAQSIPTYGEGWDGPGLGAATLLYVFSKMTTQLDPAAAEAEIERAMAQWSKAVQVTWKPGTNPTGAQTVNILFATYDHGDGFPFDGPGGVLAHTFYPTPPNPEPIAGDMHLDDSETWKIGADTDLFSVALHELGHALGLGHADDPSAVMYPYYQMETELSPLDISTVQTLYATAEAGGTGGTTGGGSSGGSPAPTPVAPTTPVTPSDAPLAMTVNAPPTSTAATSISLTGTTTGGKGTVLINWSTGQNASGSVPGAAAWTISDIPLVLGLNTITIVGSNGSTQLSKVVTVTGVAPPVTTPVPTPPVTTPPVTTPPVTTPPVSTPPVTTPSSTAPPTLTVTSPSSSTMSTTASSVTISGTASDSVGVAAVTWATNTGQSGTATGTSNWTATIPMLVGSNAVIIYAKGTAGNSTWRSVVVTRN